jgi:hypothetical protein
MGLSSGSGGRQMVDPSTSGGRDALRPRRQDDRDPSGAVIIGHKDSGSTDRCTDRDAARRARARDPVEISDALGDGLVRWRRSVAERRHDSRPVVGGTTTDAETAVSAGTRDAGQTLITPGRLRGDSPAATTVGGGQHAPSPRRRGTQLGDRGQKASARVRTAEEIRTAGGGAFRSQGRPERPDRPHLVPSAPVRTRRKAENHRAPLCCGRPFERRAHGQAISGPGTAERGDAGHSRRYRRQLPRATQILAHREKGLTEGPTTGASHPTHPSARTGERAYHRPRWERCRFPCGPRIVGRDGACLRSDPVAPDRHALPRCGARHGVERRRVRRLRCVVPT